MNECERYQELISGMIDGELSAEEEAEVRTHLAQCPECSAMYEAFAAVGEAIRDQDVPDTLHAGIMANISAAEKARRTQHTIVRLRPILAAAACLVVLVGTVFALKNTMFPARNAMKAADAEAPKAMAPSVMYAGSGASGAAQPAESAEESAIIESKIATAGTPTADTAANAVMDAVEAPKEAPVPEPQAAEREQNKAEAPVFTMRLDAVTADGLRGTVTDDQRLALALKDTQITILWDGDTDGLEPGMLLQVTLASEQTGDDGTLRAASVSVIE